MYLNELVEIVAWWAESETTKFEWNRLSFGKKAESNQKNH